MPMSLSDAMPATEPAAAPAFEVRGVRKHYRLDRHTTVEVLRGVDLTVRAGEWVALVGASGCGKSTLLHLLGALDEPDQGVIACLGRPYAGMKAVAKATLRRQDIGFVFQSYHLFPELDALENVMLPGMQGGIKNASGLADRARELLVRFGLEMRLRHRPLELSGGEQQRVALARALINGPRILLADEPTGNLDAAAAAGIIGLLEQLHRDEGKTIVMVTHDHTLAQRADHILHMTNGLVTTGQ